MVLFTPDYLVNLVKWLRVHEGDYEAGHTITHVQTHVQSTVFRYSVFRGIQLPVFFGETKLPIRSLDRGQNSNAIFLLLVASPGAPLLPTPMAKLLTRKFLALQYCNVTLGTSQ